MTMLASLTADLRRVDLDRIEEGARREAALDAYAAETAIVRARFDEVGGRTLLIALAVASARRQLRTGGVVSFREILADILGGGADATEVAIVQLAREPVDRPGDRHT